VEPVVAAAAHVDDRAGSPAVPAVTSSEVTPTETATAAEAPIAMVATTEASARMTTAKTATAGMASTKAAATGVATAKPAPAEVTASATAAEMSAKGRCVIGRECAEWNRDGSSGEHGLECLADHDALQCIAGRPVRFGN